MCDPINRGRMLRLVHNVSVGATGDGLEGKHRPHQIEEVGTVMRDPEPEGGYLRCPIHVCKKKR